MTSGGGGRAACPRGEWDDPTLADDADLPQRERLRRALARECSLRAALADAMSDAEETQRNTAQWLRVHEERWADALRQTLVEASQLHGTSGGAQPPPIATTPTRASGRHLNRSPQGWAFGAAGAGGGFPGFPGAADPTGSSTAPPRGMFLQQHSALHALSSLAGTSGSAAAVASPAGGGLLTPSQREQRTPKRLEALQSDRRQQLLDAALQANAAQGGGANLNANPLPAAAGGGAVGGGEGGHDGSPGGAHTAPSPTSPPTTPRRGEHRDREPPAQMIHSNSLNLNLASPAERAGRPRRRSAVPSTTTTTTAGAVDAPGGVGAGATAASPESPSPAHPRGTSSPFSSSTSGAPPPRRLSSSRGSCSPLTRAPPPVVPALPIARAIAAAAAAPPPLETPSSQRSSEALSTDRCTIAGSGERGGGSQPDATPGTTAATTTEQWGTRRERGGGTPVECAALLSPRPASAPPVGAGAGSDGDGGGGGGSSGSLPSTKPVVPSLRLGSLGGMSSPMKNRLPKNNSSPPGIYVPAHATTVGCGLGAHAPTSDPSRSQPENSARTIDSCGGAGEM